MAGSLEEVCINIWMETDTTENGEMMFLMVKEHSFTELGKYLKVCGKMDNLTEKYKYNYTTVKDLEELIKEDLKMVREYINMLMELSSKVFGKTIELQVLVLYSIIIIVNMKDFLNKIKRMVQAQCHPIKVFIQVTGCAIKRTEKELWTIIMAIFIKDNGRMVWRTVMEYINITMVINTQECGNKIKSKEKEPWKCQQAIFIMEIGQMVKSKEKESITSETPIYIKVHKYNYILGYFR
jgi:hypothetical protein